MSTRPKDPGDRAADTDPYAPLAKLLPKAEWVQALTLGGARRALATLLKARQANHVLDVCCGAGAQARALAREGFAVVGVDASATMIGLARGRSPDIPFHHLEAGTMRYQGDFDAALVSLALHEMDEGTRQAVWAAMRRAVRPGGWLVAMDYAPPEHPRLLGALARKIIYADERSFDQVHPPHWANFQTFMAGGGLPGWLAGQGEPITQESRHLFGNLAVLLVEKQP